MGFSVVSEITPAVIPSVFITHVKMGRMESSAPPTQGAVDSFHGQDLRILSVEKISCETGDHSSREMRNTKYEG